MRRALGGAVSAGGGGGGGEELPSPGMVWTSSFAHWAKEQKEIVAAVEKKKMSEMRTGMAHGCPSSEKVLRPGT